MASERGVSTVVDVAVCLLLIGAAVATLSVAAAPDHDEVEPDADRTAASVASVTTAVPTGQDRLDHDTLAGHLATATVANATIEGASLTASTYPDAVRAETVDLTDDRVFVTARWEPYPDAPLRGQVIAGDPPPPGAHVAATTLAMDSGLDLGAGASDGSVEALAEAIAMSYVEWLFPTGQTRAALVDPRTAPVAGGRYRTVGGSLDADVAEAVAEADVRSANEELAVALATHLEADLRARYGTPDAARADLSADEVVVVVRRWQR